jgi:signal transduction histidine kinase
MELSRTGRFEKVKKLWTAPAPTRWELAAESIAIRIRWFGLVIGFAVANGIGRDPDDLVLLNGMLGVGLLYALLDTSCSLHNKLFILSRYPLVISLLEAMFITLLCRFDTGMTSPFRYYYLLSVLVCALRYSARAAYLTCGLHMVAYSMLMLTLPLERQDLGLLVLTNAVLVWVTWTATAMSTLLRRAGVETEKLNRALREEQILLEERINARTRELNETQAKMLNQEKRAAFGLLAAGIAHEVGNPLTCVSSLVQLLQRRAGDAYVQEKLHLAADQLDRIQGILRELINFSRPAANERVWVRPEDIVADALKIAKYYKPLAQRQVRTQVEPDLPALLVVREQVAQALLNLILNAVDATQKHGTITVMVAKQNEQLVLAVHDDGVPIPREEQARLFEPYFTTKPHGTGLGLFMSRRLAEDLGGTLEFELTADQGKIFRIHLPIGREVHARTQHGAAERVALSA